MKDLLNDPQLKRKMKRIGIILVVIILLIVIISGLIKRSQNKKCSSLREEIINLADKYVSNMNILPNLNGESVTVELSQLSRDVTFKKERVLGTITYTKYNDEYVKTLVLTNASYCTTKSFTKQKDNYDSSKNVKVEVTYNYYDVDTYKTNWTGYIPSEYISEEETDGVLLPLDSRRLPVVPNQAVNLKYIRETKNYYSYRDKQWKWYRNNVKYSAYSSEKPKGYENKDIYTAITTDPTEWSLDYPEVKDYRRIETKAGYRWYYEENGNKVYWESGKYSPNSPGEQYKYDANDQVRMYSYTDTMWRWYNGNNTRMYSSYSSTKPQNYNYRDDDLSRYTNWTIYYDKSYVDNSNKSYREERINVYSRYLIEYQIYSLPKLNENVSLAELEEKTGKTYEELINDKTKDVEVHFKFLYE